MDAWLERRGPKCVAPFANERRVGLDELADADAWEIVPEKSAVYYLMWPEEEDPRAGPDGGPRSRCSPTRARGRTSSRTPTFWTGDEEEKEEEKEGKEDESDESDAEGSSPKEDAFVGDAPSSPSSFPPRGLIRLPLGAWAFCGACDGAPSMVGDRRAARRGSSWWSAGGRPSANGSGRWRAARTTEKPEGSTPSASRGDEAEEQVTKKTHERDEARRSRDDVLKAPGAAAVNRGRANKQYPRRRLIRIVYNRPRRVWWRSSLLAAAPPREARLVLSAGR